MGLRVSSALVWLGFAGTSSPIPLCTRQVYSASLPGGHVFVNVVCRSAADLCISFAALSRLLCSSSKVIALQEHQLDGPRSNVVA